MSIKYSHNSLDPPISPNKSWVEAAVAEALNKLQKTNCVDFSNIDRGVQISQVQRRRRIPSFYGIDDPAGYLEWEEQMERVFDGEYYSEREKIGLALRRFRGDAIQWWNHLYTKRKRTGEPQVASWFELKYFMKEEFVSRNYRRKAMSQQEHRQRRPSPRHSYEVEVPKRSNKHEHVLQKLKSTPSEVMNTFETQYDLSLVSSRTDFTISNVCDELTCLEPEKPSSLVSVSQDLEENAAVNKQKNSTQEEELEQPNNVEAEENVEPSSNPQEYTNSAQDDVMEQLSSLEPSTIPQTSILHQQESENCFPQTSKKQPQGKYLESKQRMKPNLLSLGAEYTILRTTLCKGWDYSEPKRKHSAVVSCPENSFDVGAFKVAYLSNQEELGNEAGCSGKLTHQSSFTKWFHHNDMSEQKVMDFTNWTNLAVRDQDMYAFQGAFRANQKDSGYNSNCFGFFSHQGSESKWNHLKRSRNELVMNFQSQQTFSLSCFQISKFETLQSYIWRPGEFSKPFIYMLQDYLVFKYTDMSRLPLSKASNAGVEKGVERTRRPYKREEDGRFIPPDLDRDKHQDIIYFVLEKQEPPDSSPKPELNEDLRANLFKGGGDDAIWPGHGVKMELIGLIYEVLDREKYMGSRQIMMGFNIFEEISFGQVLVHSKKGPSSKALIWSNNMSI